MVTVCLNCLTTEVAVCRVSRLCSLRVVCDTWGLPQNIGSLKYTKSIEITFQHCTTYSHYTACGVVRPVDSVSKEMRLSCVRNFTVGARQNHSDWVSIQYEDKLRSWWAKLCRWRRRHDRVCSSCVQHKKFYCCDFRAIQLQAMQHCFIFRIAFVR